jgi:hypothetical protein
MNDSVVKISLKFVPILVVGIIAGTFYRYVILNNYLVEGFADCSPVEESCFVYQCDPDLEECSTDPEENVSYYKIVQRKANRVPLCNPMEEDCAALECSQEEEGCRVIYCTEEGALEVESSCAGPNL